MNPGKEYPPACFFKRGWGIYYKLVLMAFLTSFSIPVSGS